MESANQTGAVDIGELIASRLELEQPEQDETPELEEEVEEESEEIEEETIDEDEPDDEAEEEAEEEEPEDPEFQSIDDLAEALELSVDDFKGKIKAKIKVDGVETEISLAELTNGYQRDADYRRKTMELAESKREHEEFSKAKRQELEQNIQIATNLVTQAEQALLAEYNAVDWNDLRYTDPGEYAAKLQEYQTRYQGIQQAKEISTQTQQQLTQEQAAEQDKQLTEYAKSEYDKLTEFIPEWKDFEKYKSGITDAASFLKSTYGYNENEANIALLDHRVALLVRDAMKRPAGDIKAEIAKKKVAKKPKFLKPGRKQTKQEIKADQRSKLKEKAKSGDRDSIAALIASANI